DTGQRGAVQPHSERPRLPVTGRRAELDRQFPVGQRIVASLRERELLGNGQRSHPPRHVRLREGETGGQPSPAVLDRTDGPAAGPEPANPAGDAQRGVRVTRGERRRHGPEDIAGELADGSEPGRAVLAVWDIGERRYPARVPGADGGQLAARGEVLAPVLSERLEHTEPHTAAGLGSSDQRLVDQASQQVRHVLAGDVRAGAYLLGRLQRAWPGEGRQPLEDPTLVVEEQ